MTKNEKQEVLYQRSWIKVNPDGSVTNEGIADFFDSIENLNPEWCQDFINSASDDEMVVITKLVMDIDPDTDQVVGIECATPVKVFMKQK